MIHIYDLLERTINRLQSGYLGQQWNAVVRNGRDFSGRQVASGIYLYQIFSGGNISPRHRMILLK